MVETKFSQIDVNIILEEELPFVAAFSTHTGSDNPVRRLGAIITKLEINDKNDNLLLEIFNDHKKKIRLKLKREEIWFFVVMLEKEKLLKRTDLNLNL
ncbi:hypothetical protein ACFL1Y_01980 [Patescibacteria group bacterium]